MPRSHEEYPKTRKPAQTTGHKQPQGPIKRAAGDALVDDMENYLIKFSHCCNPLSGNEIISFITRGFSVSAYKRFCPNVPRNIAESPESKRWALVHWESGKVEEGLKSTLEVVTEVHSGLLTDLTQQMFTLRLFIHSLNSRETKNDKTIISTTITVNDIGHLAGIISKLSGTEGIPPVRRS